MKAVVLLLPILMQIIVTLLGYTASILISIGKTGYMSSVRNTTAAPENWLAGGVPITMMMNMEKRSGVMKPVIQKALVELEGAPFKKFAANRKEWAVKTSYVYPGPIQYWGARISVRFNYQNIAVGTCENK